jgi:alpha-mannosidase
MRQARGRRTVIGALALLAGGALGAGAQIPPGTPPSADPARPELYVVGTAHLDTQWRWTIQRTIEEFIPATLRDNFGLFERYPGYVFSFEGAFRYMLMKEFYPSEYERLKRHVADGRWKVAGSWVDAVDTNIPSPESLTRQALYGNGFFRREFGVTSRDVFLPDCFGFGYALPSVAAHCGLSGFSTQKLTWGSAYGVPFDIGLWQGVDGARLVAAINPGEYVARIRDDLSADSTWTARARAQGETSGLYAAFRYFGTGDTGGAPTEESVAWLQRSLTGPGPLRVKSVASDQLARDVLALPPAARERLPQHRGELLMTDHGAGCYTSQVAMKRWNRKNELLADAAERASVMAHWLGGAVYPRETLRQAWIRFLWHQFHDDLTGTSVPEAYAFSWNDEAIAQNQFAAVLTDAIGAVSRGLNTRSRGTAVVVYNPLSVPREDIVTATLRFEDGVPRFLRVLDPQDREMPAQLGAIDGKTAEVTFLARVAPLSCTVFDVLRSLEPSTLATGLEVGPDALQNERYRVELGTDGDIARIYDRRENRRLLHAPLRLQLLRDAPRDWQAWEVDYADVMASPRELVSGPARVTVLEAGPARVMVEVAREAAGSTFRQRISLAAGGAGDRIEIDHEIDWRSPGTLLKAEYPLAVDDGEAVYDLGLGTIARGVNRPELYEVPAQQWADLSETDGSYGVAVMNDCRYGWDHPDPSTLRLTLVHTPEGNDRWQWIADQASQDLGRHRVKIALSGHRGDWRRGRVVWEAARLNQPLLAFQPGSHGGPLKREFSLLRVEPAAGDSGAAPDVAVRAVKLAEDGEELVVRLQELAGRATTARLSFAAPIAAMREVNGAEESGAPGGLPEDASLAPAELIDGRLQVPFGPYRLRTFALWLGSPGERLLPPEAMPIEIPYNLDGISLEGDPNDGDFDRGRTLAGELLPAVLVREGIPFRLGPTGPGALNVLACRGQAIELPPGDYDQAYVLAAAVGGDHGTLISTDDEPVPIWVQDYADPIAQWDSRLWGGEFHSHPDSIAPAYVKPAEVAWVGNHSHGANGENEAYRQTYLFKYRIDLPRKAWVLDLPHDESVRIFAITLARNPNARVRPAQPLIYPPRATLAKIEAPRLDFIDETRVRLSTPVPGATIRYTLDGTDPTPSSPVYRDPLRLTATTTVKARAFARDLDDRFVTRATFRRLTPRAAVSADGARPGLRCAYYEGEWSRLPDFASLSAARTEVRTEVGIPDYARPENFALEFSGYFRAPAGGLYTFYLASDDGSSLVIGDQTVVDNDGLHGKGEVAGSVALEAGHHPIRVRFFQRGGDEALELRYDGPGIPRGPVPAEALRH